MPDLIRTWHDAFADPAGGFHDRLDARLKPVDLPKRLVTQCRQIYVYASAGMDMREAFTFLYKNFRVPKTGGSRFSLADDTYDLYGHTFILLACAALGETDYAAETITFIDEHFRRKDGAGFFNALDKDLRPLPGPLAQNPHMHLLEGCLAMAEISENPRYRAMAREMLDLFFSHFFDGTVVREYHDGEKSRTIETGHQSEWIWLLTRYRDVLGDDPRIPSAMVALFSWVRAQGIDKTHGGIFNAQTRDGIILDDKKRIWPVCETLRAAKLMGDTALADEMHALLGRHYLRKDGFWVEILNRDLTPVTDYLPGTTPYHLSAVLGEYCDSAGNLLDLTH